MRRRLDAAYAAWYDRANTRAEQSWLGPLRARLLGELVGDVLEIGAGTGNSLPYYRADATVTLVEPSPFMRRQLVHAVDAAPVSAQIAAGVAEQLPVDDHSVDIVVCFLVLCSVRDVPRALSEIRRVLRPGGRLVLAEHVRGTGLRALAQSAISPLNRHFAGGCRSDRRTVEALDIAGFEIMALEEIAGPGRFSPTAPVVAGTATPRLTGQLPATGHEAPGTMLR